MWVKEFEFFVFTTLRQKYFVQDLVYNFKDSKIKFAGHIYFFKN